MTQPTFAVVWTKMQVEFSNPTFDIVAIIRQGGISKVLSDTSIRPTFSDGIWKFKTANRQSNNQVRAYLTHPTHRV